ncbi:MAG: hypothetical protein ABR573_02345 [Candidatus Dormibacteria bacterium]
MKVQRACRGCTPLGRVGLVLVLLLAAFVGACGPASAPAAGGGGPAAGAPDDATVKHAIVEYESAYSSITFQSLDRDKPFVVAPGQQADVNIGPGVSVYPVVATYRGTRINGTVHQVSAFYYVYQRQLQGQSKWIAQGSADPRNRNVETS